MAAKAHAQERRELESLAAAQLTDCRAEMRGLKQAALLQASKEKEVAVQQLVAELNALKAKQGSSPTFATAAGAPGVPTTVAGVKAMVLPTRKGATLVHHFSSLLGANAGVAVAAGSAMGHSLSSLSLSMLASLPSDDVPEKHLFVSAQVQEHSHFTGFDPATVEVASN